MLGSIAVKSQMALAPSALSHLESAYNLFARVSDQARTGKILVSYHVTLILMPTAYPHITLAHSSEIKGAGPCCIGKHGSARPRRDGHAAVILRT